MCFCCCFVSDNLQKSGKSILEFRNGRLYVFEHVSTLAWVYMKLHITEESKKLRAVRQAYSVCCGDVGSIGIDV